jgi:hypothetical protein
VITAGGFAPGDHRRRVQHPQERVGGGRFAAARLPGQAEDLARADLERDVVDRDHRTARGQILDPQPIDP